MPSRYLLLPSLTGDSANPVHFKRSTMLKYVAFFAVLGYAWVCLFLATSGIPVFLPNTLCSNRLIFKLIGLLSILVLRQSDSSQKYSAKVKS